MPQLFYGKSKLQSIEAFIQARNAIIKKYRSNPQIPVSLPDIQGIANLSDKDLGHILDFLVQWGLVNYQVEASSESAGFKYPTKVPVYLMEDQFGVLSASELSLNPLEYLYQFEPLQGEGILLVFPTWYLTHTIGKDKGCHNSYVMMNLNMSLDEYS